MTGPWIVQNNCVQIFDLSVLQVSDGPPSITQYTLQEEEVEVYVVLHDFLASDANYLCCLEGDQVLTPQ